VVEHLVGLQSQSPRAAYVGLWTRLSGFRAERLEELMLERRAVRIALMRSTVHLVSARDCLPLRRLTQPAIARTSRHTKHRRDAGVDDGELAAAGRELMADHRRTFSELGELLHERWPGCPADALAMGVRELVPLVQVPPRGLWGRSGPIAHTSIEAWLGARPATPPMTIDDLVRRYLAAFGPASVMDVQAWCGLTRLAEVLDRLRPTLVTLRDETGRELFDLPGASRPEPDTPAPPRFLYDFENLLLSYADRSRVVRPGLARSITARTQESLSTFLLDGLVSGLWAVQRERAGATLVVTPFRRLTAGERRALSDEGAGLLAFAAADSTERDIRFGPVSPP
jgi:hypothetical protein